MRFPLFFFQLYGWCATPRHNRESSEENRINLTARYNQHERKFTFLVLFVSLPLSFLQPVFPRLRLFSSTYSSSPLLDIILSPKNFTKKKKKKKKRIEKGASFEPTTRHYFFRWGQRSNQCVNCSRCGSWDVFFLSLSLPLYRLTDAFRRRRVYRRKSDYERYITKIQKRLRVVCFISFAAGKPEMSLADSTRSLIVNFFWPWMIKAERRGGRT